MKTYLAYVRVSTVRQGERGSSLQEQRSAIEAYASRNNLQIAAWYRELQTAAKQGRRVFNRMLQDLEASGACGIIIHKIDRSARNLRDWAYINELIDRGIEVHFAHDSLDMHTRGGRLAADVQAVVAADFIRNLREEVVKGQRGRLKQGLYPFAAPVGYLDCGKGKAKAVDPSRAPLVHEAFERYATGNVTLHQLRREMTARGLTSRVGKPICVAKYATMLRNPFYTGIIRIRSTGDLYEGAHTAIVSLDLYERVQAVLDGRAFPRHQKHQYLFSRLLRCLGCSRLLVGEKQAGNVYYRCHAQQCRGTSVRETYVGAELENLFRHAFLDDGDLRDLRDLVASAGQDARRTAEQRRSSIELQLSKCDDRLMRLTDALLEGLVDKPLFNERRERLLIEKQRLNECLKDIKDSISPEMRLLAKLEVLNPPQLSHETANVAQKREWVQEICSKLVVDRKYLGVELRFPFSDILKTRLLNKCAPGRIDTRSLLSSLQTQSDSRIFWLSELPLR